MLVRSYRQRHVRNSPVRTTTTTSRFSTGAPLSLRAPSFVVALALAMSDGGRAGASSAAKDAWELVGATSSSSVRMALAAAQHHSAPKCAGLETHEALRGQTTARAAGKRPAPLAEVSGRQEAAVTVGYVAAAGALSLATPSAGGCGGRRRRRLTVEFLVEWALLDSLVVDITVVAQRPFPLVLRP